MIKKIIKHICLPAIGGYLGLSCLLYFLIKNWITTSYVHLMLAGIIVSFNFILGHKGTTRFTDFTDKQERIVKSVFIFILIYFVIFGINHFIWTNNMNIKMKEFLGDNAENYSVTIEKNANKMITYLEDIDKYSDVCIPTGYVARNPEHLRYIVKIESRDKEKIGYWAGSSIDIYMYYYNVYVYDLKTNSTIINDIYCSRYEGYSSIGKAGSQKSSSLEIDLKEKIAHKKGVFSNLVDILISAIPLLIF